VCAGHKNKHEKADNGAYLSWSNLNYSVFVRKGLKKRELQLLHDVSGYVKPGMMLALMVRTFLTPPKHCSHSNGRMDTCMIVGVVWSGQVDADGRAGQAEDRRQDHR
jgi:hypothetical protein